MVEQVMEMTRYANGRARYILPPPLEYQRRINTILEQGDDATAPFAGPLPRPNKRMYVPPLMMSFRRTKS